MIINPLIAVYYRHAGQGTTMHTLLLGRSCRTISRSYWKAKLHQSCTAPGPYSVLFSVSSRFSLAPAPVPEGKHFIALSTPEGGYLFEGGSSFFVTNYLAIRLERNRDISQGAGLANAESRERFTTRGGAHAHQIRPSASVHHKT